jgi:hypothetical protein
MIYKSRTKSVMTYKVYGKDETQVDEKCSLCDKELPGGALVLRKNETNKVICVLCLTEIAECNG